MKIDRLIGILSVLLQKDRVTAPELAEKFEVSRRTINRDIEDLCKAGIPIITAQGGGGGISIMDSYRPSKTLLTSRDMQGILAGLRSLDSISGTKYYSQLMDKLKVGSSEFTCGRDSILIDLSSWYKNSLTPKIDMISKAIDERLILEFIYYSPKEESVRNIEPYYLVFKWCSWYVYGYCLKRNDFRLFKLNRLANIKLIANHFDSRQVPMMDFSPDKIWENEVLVKTIFEPEVKWRVIEEYGPDCISEMPDGKLAFQSMCNGGESLISWILSFGDKAELLEPAELRDELRVIARKINKVYGEE